MRPGHDSVCGLRVSRLRLRDRTQWAGCDSVDHRLQARRSSFRRLGAARWGDGPLLVLGSEPIA
jgi:hypothetical protein